MSELHYFVLADHGMGAWKELQRFNHKQNADTYASMERRFVETWSVGNPFCLDKGGTPAWHPELSTKYLPREYLNQ